MSSSVDEAVPSPSSLEDPETAVKDSPSRKTVQFDKDVQDQEVEESSPEPRKKRIDSQTRFRRQSVMGESGFVTQLLEEYLEKDTEDEPRKKPIRKQTLSERRDSVRAVEADLSCYIKEATRKSKASIFGKKTSSSIKLHTLSSAEKLEELQNLSKLLPGETLPSSGWQPSHIREEEDPGIQQQRSWVGTYIVGKDYWSPEEDDTLEKTTEVGFSMDERRKSWYEMPLQQSYFKDSAFRASKHKTMNEIEILKDQTGKEYEQKRKERLTAAAVARQESKILDVWSEEFKDYFREISRSWEYSHHGTYISMADSDKWLERAGILDYSELTLIHTGFCFLAVGGTRERGLSFEAFKQYLQMISFTTGSPLADIIGRMITCQRKFGSNDT